MGTRSLTFVHEEDGPAIVCIYQQYDGYFDGVGDRILSFLKGSEVVNGISLSVDGPVFNGAGDLAARLITYFKDGDPNDAGGVYIEPADTEDGGMGTEFAYHIYCTVGEEPRLLAVSVYSKQSVYGPVSEIVWPSDEDEVEDDLSGPISDDQRRALFAMFSRVFDSTNDGKRRTFTQGVLGRHDRTSWASNSPASITVDEAFRLMRALDAIEQTQNA